MRRCDSRENIAFYSEEHMIAAHACIVCLFAENNFLAFLLSRITQNIDEEVLVWSPRIYVG